MSRIRIMSEDLSNRIAAGEVIERPASVVKELVENAVDAGARHITVTAERSGIRRIVVADDGCGMDADDALLCIEPHGTSKLRTVEDIDSIVTLGFRGEALPSIAAVSRFTLLTRTADSGEATRVRLEGGRLLETAPGAGPVGTTVEVRDLFFNTPARRKFLKSPATEAHHIEEAVMALAIGYREIGFELKIDGRMVFNCPAGGTLDYRLRELFGGGYAGNLIPVEHREGSLRITGLIAGPGFTRIGRREQRVFINRRAVEAPAIYRGIREGYGTLESESGRFPPVVLFLELPPEEVDVNVHPAKREVRFKSEFAITRCVSAAVAAALKGGGRLDSAATGGPANGLPLSGKVPIARVLEGVEITYRPKNALQPDLANWHCVDEDSEEKNPPTAKVSEAVGRSIPGDADIPEFSSSDPAPEMLTDRDDGATGFPAGTGASISPEPAKPCPEPEPEPVSIAFAGDWPEEVLGIFDATYILASGREGLVLIDQHAAHERVMFERLLAEARHTGAASQRLLLPQTVELSRPQAGLLLRNSKVFEKLGFDVEPAGGATIIINAVPNSLGTRRALDEVLPDMLDELVENASARLPVEPEYVARAACHAAVKAHDELTLEAARELLRQLRRCRQGTLCPHGRPTMVTITRKELEKRFARR